MPSGSVIVDVAEAVALDLAAGEFSQDFLPERCYDPVHDLEGMKQLNVSVVPSGLTEVRAARNATQDDYSIDVAVQKKLGNRTPAAVDPLMDLVREIAQYLRLRPLMLYPAAAWLSMENAPIYSHEHLQKFTQFTSVLTFTFRVLEEELSMLTQWQTDVLNALQVKLLAGPDKVIVDSTANGKTLATLLGAAVEAGLEVLTLVPGGPGIYWAAGAASAASAWLPDGGVELKIDKAKADELKFYAAANIDMMVTQEG